VGQRSGLQILDIGAGSGVWGIAFAQQDPLARVTLVDYPKVLGIAKQFVARHVLADRFQYLAGNIREVDFGREQYDVAILGHICHSEGARNTRMLFQRIRRALRPGGRLLIAEFLVDEERRTETFPLLFAVNMLVNTEEGDTFSLTELRTWLEEAGFKTVETLEAPAPSPLIVARVGD
jgi:ubiquinone/menaquinone biosynthesis C-methylase UbiE